MPNRIIKDSIHTSESVEKMTDFQFRLWINLITYVDDFGRGDARPAVIKGTCFPLKERLTLKDIEVALNALAGIGCVGLYEVDGKPYLYLPKWGSHQTIRNKKSKFPAPESACNQIKSNDCKCPRNPIQSESNPNPESESKEDEEERARAEIDLNSPWYRFVREYHQNIGDFPSSAHEVELLQSNFDILGADVMSEAIRVTALKHTSNPHRFLQSVCADWIAKDVHSVERARAVAMDHERQQRGGAGFANNRGNAGAEYRGLPWETVV